MNWTHSRTAVQALAGEYVLGTLQGPARRRFEAVMAIRPEVAAAVRDAEQRLHRLAAALPPVAPSPALWDRLAREAGLQMPAAAAAAPATAPAAQPAPALPASPATRAATRPAGSPATRTAAAPSGVQATRATAPPAPPRTPTRAPATAGTPGLAQTLSRWLRTVLAPVPAGALALGLVGGLVIPQIVAPVREPAYDTALPESYVGVLATREGRPGLIVASLRHGKSVDLKQVSPVVPPPGQTLFLWTIDAAGQAQPVGPVPHGPFVQAPLADTAENVFRTAVELGVTLEPVGTQPAQPGGAWVYRGLCGKVWRVPPGAAPVAAAPRAPVTPLTAAAPVTGAAPATTAAPTAPAASR